MVQSVEINYACKDQHIDATFDNYKEAVQYVEYFKPHHNYVVVPFFTFGNNPNI